MTVSRTITPGQVSPVTPQTQEIRMATTLTGGVSLAVWMGGVAREIDLLTQASNLRRLAGAPLTLTDSDPRRRYLDLLNLLDVTADVDVLSGTSAGGINAALLAYARARKRDLGKLRDLWLQVGALETLLRNPTDSNVPSLLQGDAQMYAQLCKALPDLSVVQNPSPNPKPISTTLFITTTLLTGETSRFTDTYGTLIQDVDHRGMFRFTENTLSRTDALALAARSSASFPGAFEPSFLPYAQEVPASDSVPERPPVGSLSNITRNHWVADGGLLDNQPIDALLETIFARPARRLVRRVLLYIVPTTGPALDPLNADQGDDVAKPYTLLDGLLKDLGAVWNQSISADLRAIRQHNERIGVRTDVRQRLAQLAVRSRPAEQPTAEQADEQGQADRQSAEDLLLLTDGLFQDYRAREADQLASKLVPELLRLLSTWPQATAGKPVQPGGQPPTLPSRWAAALLPGSTVEQDCRQLVHTVLNERWPAKPTDLSSLAGFGRGAYHGGKAIALSMLRCGFLLAEWDDPNAGPARTDHLVRLLTTLHAAFQPDEDIDVADFVQAQAGLPEIQALTLPAAVGELARRYLDAMDRPQPTPTGPEPTGTAPTQPVPTPPEPSTSPGLVSAWQNVASVVAELAADPVAADVSTSPAGPAGSRAEQVATAADHLRTYADYLAGSVDDQSRALRLFALHAAHRAMMPMDADVDQPVELIQLSSDTRTLLDLDRATAASKLTGLQLNHFGAFFKRSWRSNDWMWGRLDGSGWLIHLLLDPRRINTVAIAKDGSRATGFLSQLGAIGVADPPAAPGIPLGPPVDGVQLLLNVDTIRAELAFLDDATEPVPVSLPLTALWVSRGQQQEVAAEELPALAGTILDPETNESESTAARSWATKVQAISPADREKDAAGLLAACPVPQERLASELGTPLMVRTTAKAAAVVTAALNSMPQIPGPVRPFTSTVRTITLAGYRVTNMVKAVPRRMILAGLALLLIGALLATGQSTVFGLTGALILAVGGYLVVFGAWQTSRAALAAVITATLVGGAGALTFPSVRHGLFGVKGGKSGWLNDRVLWLGQQWWHPLVGLGVLLLVLAVLGVLFARHGKPRASARRFPRWLPLVGGRQLPRAVPVIGAMLVAAAVVGVLAYFLALKG